MLKPKGKHLLISSSIGVIVALLLVLFGALKKISIVSASLASTLLTTSGVFVGFIISALGIYYSIPMRDEIKVALKKQGYYKQVALEFIIGIIGFAITIALSIVDICLYNPSSALLLQHVFNSATISVFVFSTITVVLTSINFFKIVMNN